MIIDINICLQASIAFNFFVTSFMFANIMNCHLIQDKPEKPGCRTGFLNIITHLHTWDFSELIKIGSVNTTLYGILGQQNWVQKLIGFLFLRSHNRAMVTTSSPLRKLEFHSQILSLIKWEILDKLSRLFTILVMKSGFWTIAKKHKCMRIYELCRYRS